MNRCKRALISVALLLVLFFAAVPTTHAETTSSGGVYHTIRYGETLSQIAVYYGTTVHALLAANPHIRNPNLIYAGTVLFIPQQTYYPPSYGYCRYQHYVRYGENLSGIAYWYGVSPYAIAEANHIYNLNYIYAGQYLCIP